MPASCSPRRDMSIRDIELGSTLVRVREGSLSDEAGVVVWDASLVLVNYLSLLAEQSQGMCA
jgi:hypothetical protein